MGSTHLSGTGHEEKSLILYAFFSLQEGGKDDVITSKYHPSAPVLPVLLFFGEVTVKVLIYPSYIIFYLFILFMQEISEYLHILFLPLPDREYPGF